jgi:hypothetical protein
MKYNAHSMAFNPELYADFTLSPSALAAINVGDIYTEKWSEKGVVIEKGEIFSTFSCSLQKGVKVCLSKTSDNCLDCQETSCPFRERR